MKPTVLLVNPPIYDFSAYDFWLKPYGLLRAGGMLGDGVDLLLYDYMDRHNPDFGCSVSGRLNDWGCGAYRKERLAKPAAFKEVWRHYNRFGMKRGHFQAYLGCLKPVDVVLIQTSLTYWYPGVREVIEDVRRLQPGATIVLGGFYATCCADHARSLGPDVVVSGDRLEPLFELVNLSGPAADAPPAWALYPDLKTGVVKLTEGCPFGCSYCYVPQSGVRFRVRPVEGCLEELAHLVRCGAEHVAFYDDALLYQPEKALFPFFEGVLRRGLKVNFHTPNALHARFLTREAAAFMVRGGVKTFYLGFESRSDEFHGRTGGKVVSEELASAVENLRRAGADLNHVTAYEMLGHPRFAAQQLEGSMRFASSLGIRVMLSEFSPIPGTPDGELCRDVVDLDEPLNHNKTAFPILSLGTETVGYYKELCRFLNRRHVCDGVSGGRPAKAFTLVEILVVIWIIAVLLGVSFPLIRNAMRYAAAGGRACQTSASWERSGSFMPKTTTATLLMAINPEADSTGDYEWFRKVYILGRADTPRRLTDKCVYIREGRFTRTEIERKVLVC